jgi:hypothetical protein
MVYPNRMTQFGFMIAPGLGAIQSFTAMSNKACPIFDALGFWSAAMWRKSKTPRPGAKNLRTDDF